MLYIVVTTDYIHQNTTSIIANPVQVQDIYLGCCIHHSEERNLTKIQLKQAHRFLYLMNVLNNLLKLVIIENFSCSNGRAGGYFQTTEYTVEEH